MHGAPCKRNGGIWTKTLTAQTTGNRVEIAAFYLALPDNVLNLFGTSILPEMLDAESLHPWTYQDRLEVR